MSGRIPRASGCWPARCSGPARWPGLGGGVEISGVTYTLFQNLSPGYGFTAIAVALLARLNPLGIIVTGVLFGGARGRRAGDAAGGGRSGGGGAGGGGDDHPGGGAGGGAGAGRDAGRCGGETAGA